MRACIQCGETGGTRIGGPCITCVFDDSDCDDLVAEGKRVAVDETVAAIVAWLRSFKANKYASKTADAIERGDWKENE